MTDQEFAELVRAEAGKLFRVAWGRCVPLDLALRTGTEWVDVPLKCTDGLTFDDIGRDAWR